MVTNKSLPSHLGEIPSDWKRVRFSEVMTVRQGLQIAISKRLKTYTEEAKEYITIQSINRKDQEREYVVPTSDRVICTKDDVLMTRTGNTGIVVTDVEGVFHNNFFLMDFDRSILDKKFLVNYLRSKRVQHLILTKAGASTIPDLNHKDFYSIELPLAPLPEQRKIAKILSTWDKAISTTERLIDNSKQQKKALMQQLLTGKKRLLDDSGRVFEGEWESVLLENIVDRPICYGVLKPGEHTEGGIPLLRIQDLKSPNFDIENLLKITNELHQEFKRTILRTGDLVISIVGTLGKVLKVPKQLDGANITRAFAVIGVSTQDTDFIKHYLSSDHIQEWLSNTATGNAQKVLNVAAIKKLQIKVPSLKEQQKIACILGPVAV